MSPNADAVLKTDFELRWVLMAHRLPPAAITVVSALHAGVLVLLGHPLIAATWVAVMLPVDWLVHDRVVAMLRKALSPKATERRLSALSTLRFTVVMAGPTAACLSHAGLGEVIFLTLTATSVCTGAVVQGGYRTPLILAGFAPALAGLLTGLSTFYLGSTAIALALGINALIIAGAMRGVSLYAQGRDQLLIDRRQAIDAMTEAHAAQDRLIVDLKAARDQSERSRLRLEEEIDAKSVFLSTLSHEVRTPLNGVMGIAEVLARTLLSPAQREHVETIIASGSMVRTILDDVLDAAKIEAGQMELSLAPTNLEALFTQAARFWSGPAQLKALALETRLELDPALELVDATRVQQVVFNLLSNAIKFTTVGRVLLTAKITPGASAGLRHLRVEVEDTGKGMTQAERGKLFARFVQADAAIAGRFGGSGLGLYVSRNLVTLMGGEIGVDSTPDVGSCFWFEIDVHAADGATPDFPAYEDTAPAEPLDVLAVDDNATNRRVVTLLLETLGHRCEAAVDGASALDRLQARRFDVVLLDVRMPGLSGDETLAQLRAMDGPNRNTSVIALTADAVNWNDEIAAARGFDGYVAKPIDVKQLATRVATAAEKRKSTRRPAEDGSAKLGLTLEGGGLDAAV